MLDVTVALLECPEPEAAWLRLAAELAECLRGTMGVVVNLDWQAGRGTMVAGTPGWLGQARMDSLISAHMWAHPLMRLYAVGERRVPLSLDQVADQTWYRSEAHHAGTTVGAERQIALPLRSPRGAIRTAIVGRNGRDFTEHEQAFARRLQPVLTALDTHLSELRRYRGLPDAAGQSLTPVDRAVRCGITPRELTVLSLLAEGLTAVAIGHRLSISPRTVTKHRENLYRKLGANDRLSAVLIGQELGLVVSSPGSVRV